MKTSKPLYQDFLTNKKIYNLNVGFWNRILKSSWPSVELPLYNSHFSNGKKMYDGNPISSGYDLNKRKSIRIIQNDNPGESYFDAWVKQVEIFDEEVKELVISLSLTQASKELSKAMIRKWFNGELDGASLDEYLSTAQQSREA